MRIATISATIPESDCPHVVAEHVARLSVTKWPHELVEDPLFCRGCEDSRISGSVEGDFTIAGHQLPNVELQARGAQEAESSLVRDGSPVN
jgi:hypothetical protein